MHTANHHLRGKGERNGVQRYVSLSRTMVQALELLWLAKRYVTSLDEVTLNSEEIIKPVAIAIIKLRLSEGISK